MRKWHVIAFAAVLAATVTGVGIAAAGSSTGGATVKAKDGQTYAINRYSQENLRFVPGTVSVASGSTLTFTFADKEQEPHTLTILPKAKLPRNGAQISNCRSCQVALGHLKNPKDLANALTPKNPIVHWTLDKGEPGLDTSGDSLAIESPGAHKSNSAVVSAPSGTTLYFLCAIHPWMQGKIIVK